MSVHLSVSHKNPSASKESCLSAKSQPSCHSATLPPPCPHPLSASQNYNFWPSCLSAIMHILPSDLCPAFVTFEAFWLVVVQLSAVCCKVYRLWYCCCYKGCQFCRIYLTLDSFIALSVRVLLVHSSFDFGHIDILNPTLHGLFWDEIKNIGKLLLFWP